MSVTIPDAAALKRFVVGLKIREQFNGRWVYYRGRRVAHLLKDQELPPLERLYPKLLEIERTPFYGFKESKFRDDVAAELVHQGWCVVTEHQSPHGRIDILARKSGQTRIIETKLPADPISTAHALGQLIFYGTCYPDATLWFASPHQPSDDITSIFKCYGVHIFPAFSYQSGHSPEMANEKKKGSAKKKARLISFSSHLLS